MPKYQVWTNEGGVEEFDTIEEYRAWFREKFGDFGMDEVSFNQMVSQFVFTKDP